MNVTITQIYESLSKKLGSETAEEITSLITKDVTDKLEQKTDILATKKEMYLLKEEMYKIKVDMIKWYVGLFIVLALMIIGLYFK